MKNIRDMEQIEVLVQHLNMICDVHSKMILPPDMVYNSVEDFTLKLGKEFKSAPWILKESYHRRTPKECYANALHLAIVHQELTYVEGFCYRDGLIPIAHAWCVDDSGAVFDPTLPEPEEFAYFGVPFKTSFVTDYVQYKGTYGVVDDWMRKFPMLRGTYSTEDFLENKHGNDSHG